MSATSARGRIARRTPEVPIDYGTRVTRGPDLMPRRFSSRVLTAMQRLIPIANSRLKPAQIPACRLCETPMQLRVSRKEHVFWGCTRYPVCTQTRPINQQRFKAFVR